MIKIRRYYAIINKFSVCMILLIKTGIEDEVFVKEDIESLGGTT